jgi:hypothetical protein
VNVDLDVLAADILTAALVDSNVVVCVEKIPEGLVVVVAVKPGGGCRLAIVARGHPCLLTRQMPYTQWRHYAANRSEDAGRLPNDGAPGGAMGRRGPGWLENW